MKFENMLIGFLVFTLFIIGGIMMISDMESNYAFANVSLNASDQFGSVYNTTGEIFSNTNDMKEKVLGKDISGTTSSWETMITGSYSAIRLITGSFRIIGDIANDIAKKIGIPEIIVTTIITVVILLVIFSVIYILFRFIPR